MFGPLFRQTDRAGPSFKQTDFVTLQDPRPRFGKHVLGLRLSATPSDHTFRPRLSHAFQPRLSATPSGHVFRRAIRIEDVASLSQHTFILDLIDDVIDKIEGLHIANHRPGMSTSIPKRLKTFHR